MSSLLFSRMSQINARSGVKVQRHHIGRCDSRIDPVHFTAWVCLGDSSLLPFFVVLTPDPVVGEDIRETVREVLPEARVRLSATIEDACTALLDATGDVIVTVLHATASELRCPELRRLLDMRKARVCAIHTPIMDEEPLDWIYVPPPDLPLFSGPLVSRVCSPFVCHHSAA